MFGRAIAPQKQEANDYDVDINDDTDYVSKQMHNRLRIMQFTVYIYIYI